MQWNTKVYQHKHDTLQDYRWEHGLRREYRLGWKPRHGGEPGHGGVPKHWRANDLQRKGPVNNICRLSSKLRFIYFLIRRAFCSHAIFLALSYKQPKMLTVILEDMVANSTCHLMANSLQGSEKQWRRLQLFQTQLWCLPGEMGCDA